MSLAASQTYISLMLAVNVPLVLTTRLYVPCCKRTRTKKEGEQHVKKNNVQQQTTMPKKRGTTHRVAEEEEEEEEEEAGGPWATDPL